MEKTPEEELLDRALDHLAKAGWSTGHTQRKGEYPSVKWTEDGLRKLMVLWRLFTELNGTEQIDRRIWWAFAMLSREEFDPD